MLMNQANTIFLCVYEVFFVRGFERIIGLITDAVVVSVLLNKIVLLVPYPGENLMLL